MSGEKVKWVHVSCFLRRDEAELLLESRIRVAMMMTASRQTAAAARRASLGARSSARWPHTLGVDLARFPCRLL
jgi:hypothetical protein